MALYLISYDLRKMRKYEPLYRLLNGWKAKRLLESLWLAELPGGAEAIRDIVMKTVDSDDGIAVIQLNGRFDWATAQAYIPGNLLLKKHSP